MPYRSARDPSIRSIPSQDPRHRGCDEIGSCVSALFLENTKRLILALLTFGLATRSVAQVQTAVGDDRFGVMTHFAQGWDPNWIPLIKVSGISNVRDELYWNEVEPEKNVFRFPARYDRYLGELKKDRISPLIVLSFENSNYDSGLTPYSKEGIDGFARYAVEILRHCGTQVKAVEVWNEYNGTFNHGPASANRSSTYLEMLRSTYTAIKRERPDVTVVGGATSGIPLPYWEKLMAEGALNYMDVLSVHPYRYLSSPEGIEGEIADLQQLVLKFNKGGRAMPIWVTEIGWYIKPRTAPGDLPIDEKVQADYLVRAFALLLSANVQRVYWYLFRDYEDFTMGLVRDDPQRTRKLAYFAYTTLVKQLWHADFVRRESTPDDFYSMLFRRTSGEEVRVIWSLSPKVLALSQNTLAVNIFGVSTGASGLMSVNDSPVFVTGPLHGLPRNLQDRGEILADSIRDFGGISGKGWSYGFFIGSDVQFQPLETFSTTDWKASWTAKYPSFDISAQDQHPSKVGNFAITAVRRWESSYTGSVQIIGRFRCGTKGDGVGVSVLIDGQARFRVLLGGGAPLEKTFDLIEKVHPGSTLDFAVDPGPATNIDFDATLVSATILSLH